MAAPLGGAIKNKNANTNVNKDDEGCGWPGSEVCGPLELCDVRLVERFCDQLQQRFERIDVSWPHLGFPEHDLKSKIFGRARCCVNSTGLVGTNRGRLVNKMFD